MQEECRALEELGQVMGVMVYFCKIFLFLTDNEHKLTFVTSINVRQITSVRHWRESPSCQQQHLFVSLKRLSLGRKVSCLFTLAGFHWMCVAHSCLWMDHLAVTVFPSGPVPTFCFHSCLSG